MVFDFASNDAEHARREQIRALLAESERIKKTIQTSGAAKNGPLQTSLLRQYNDVQKQIKLLRGL